MKNLLFLLTFAAFVACGQTEYYQCNCQNDLSLNNSEIINELNHLLATPGNDGESYTINKIDEKQYELKVEGKWNYIFNLNDIDNHQFMYLPGPNNYYVMSVRAKNGEDRIRIQFPHGENRVNHITLDRNTKEELLKVAELICALACQKE